ncbi:TolC family protein [Porphyromonas cangingivalis]|uniref:TolC family protein n=1 Tax=Porphyromonas cangingivalis TaxID=36874 RepID=UPI000A59C2A9|nr:TolC family protein [Porphyromonas cangingivalis]
MLQSDIQSGINRATVAFENGASLKSNIDLLSAELLNAGQRQIELRAMRRGYVEMLSAFIGREITEETVFQKPEIIPTSSTINRPELALFETQKKGFDIQDKLLTNQNLPRVSLFLQGGYGRPSLNFLSNDFSPYAIGGVRLSWNISGLYTHRKQKKNIEINRNSVDVQRDLFLFNTNLTLTQQDSEIAKLRELMASDCEIIELRESVKRSTESQLENGTATANDYIQHVNAEDQARQNLVLHEIQLLMALYNHKTTSGN